ncbi:hypothetical protein CRUP_036020 [Coryphaenoides rupestris]|nr:hypothetical protein CRUP_036020 [Coryphaenoides rupestris]
MPRWRGGEVASSLSVRSYTDHRAKPTFKAHLSESRQCCLVSLPPGPGAATAPVRGDGANLSSSRDVSPEKERFRLAPEATTHDFDCQPAAERFTNISTDLLRRFSERYKNKSRWQAVHFHAGGC